MNIEVPRLATYIRDEDVYLRVKEAELSTFNPALAHQVGILMERGCFNAHHLKVLGKIHLLASYTGPIEFGTHIAEAPTTQEQPEAPPLSQATGATPNLEEDLEASWRGWGCCGAWCLLQST